MKNKRPIALSLILLCLLATRSLSQPASKAAVGAPVVRKVDPPNWWLNYTPEVTLLLSGENLKGVKAESKSAEAAILGSQNSANGHYLFIHLRLKAQLRTRLTSELKTSAPKTEKVSIKLVSAGGSTSIEFPLRPRKDAKGDFEGFNREDVIYLIMPDRFA